MTTKKDGGAASDCLLSHLSTRQIGVAANSLGLNWMGWECCVAPVQAPRFELHRAYGNGCRSSAPLTTELI